ncbi:hypothetical protein [Putridiphycobacter roseus]|nr:hypothetical protein [Putridiphycobacter roseus]
MKTKTLLLIFGIILSTTLFSQEIKPTKRISFEGVVVKEYLGDGVFYISVKITKGDLIGAIETLYFSVGFDDNNKIECHGNADLDGTGMNEGKKIKGIIIASAGKFENFETGNVETLKCYRPVELNWL